MPDIKEILEKSKNIAIVGLSAKAHKTSNMVGKYLLDKGYNIIPVNPNYDEIFGLKCYPCLTDIPKDIKIDIVDVFMRSEKTPPVAKNAVDISAKCLWLQLGITNEESKKIAEQGGIEYVEDKCTKIEYKRFLA